MKIKKIICTALTLMLVITGFPLLIQEVNADTYTWTDDVNGLVFTYEDKTDGSVIITKIEPADSNAEAASLNLVLPDTIDNKNVTEIHYQSVKQASLYKTVTFNKYITGVPYHWGSFSNVTSITFPEDSECLTLADEAFKGCNNLTTVVLGNGLTTIGDSVFINCPKLETVTFGNSLVTIGEKAFQGTKVNSIVLPDSLTTIKAEAFSNCTSLTNLNLGNGLLSIDEKAFYRIAISELVLPNSLTTLGVNAFQNIGNLTSITWPQGNAMFNTVDGFDGCSALTNDVLSSIPSTVTSIADYAFANCHFTEVTIPQSIEYVGKYAFSKNTYLESIVIKEGSAPLTIGEYAFKESIKMVGKNIVLPERVSVLKDNSFEFSFYNTSNTFTIYNKNIVINGDPWGQTRWTTIEYPIDLTSLTSPTFIEYKTNREANPGDYPFTFKTFETNPSYTVSGTIPNGASLIANVNGTTSTPTLTEGSFSFVAPKGSYISLTISLDKYKDYVLTKKSSEFTADWNVAVTIEDMVPISTTGILEVITEGAGAMDANVSIFASDGSIVASGVAIGGQFVSSSLKQGSYTVIAIAKNSYISSITSLLSLDKLGLKESEYARVNATVVAGESVEVNINVPSVSVADYSTWVDSIGSFVDIDRSIVTLGMEFYGEVYYRMADGKTADVIKIVIPSGFEVVSITSMATKYNVDAVYNLYDTKTGIITLSGFEGNDRLSGTIYVGLRSQKTGNFAISASISSNDVTIPIGSKDFTIDSIMMKLSNELLTSREFGVTVYAQPGKTVKLKPGTGAEIVLGTTNKLGYLSTTAELPVDSIPGISYGVIAIATDDEGTHSDIEYVHIVEKTTSIKDFYFIHGNRQYYLAQNGINKSGGFYNYISDGSEASKNWTFGVSFESLTNISGNVTISIKMEDGSFRDLALSPISSTVKNGKVLTEYAGNIYLGTGEYHVFDSSMIPAGFNVRYESEVVPMEANEEYDEYLYSLAETEFVDMLKTAINNIHPEGYTQEQALDYIKSGAYNAFFNKQYYISTNTDPVILNWYNNLSNEDKQKIREMETSIDDALCMLQDFLNDNKPLYEYSSWDEYILDNWMEVVEHPLKVNNNALLKQYPVPTVDETDVDKLIEQGYTVSGNVAFKVDHKNGSHSFYYINRKNNTATEYTQKNKGITLDDWVTFSKKLKAAMACTDAGLNFIHVVGLDEIYGFAANQIVKPIAFINTVVSFFDLYNRSETFKNNIDEAAKIETERLNAEYKKKQIELQMEKGLISPECWFAIIDEARFYKEAEDCAKSRNDFVLEGLFDSAVLTAVGALLFVPTAAGAISAGSVAASLEIIKDSGAAAFTSVCMTYINATTDFCVRKITAHLNDELAYALARAEVARVRRIDACERNDFTVDYWKEAIKDPSGFVYEAVESNRIEGATATLINVTSGENFNATDYDQENPLTTDVEGRYAWDVPNGIWRVIVSKDGYANSSSADLEVPPPRMDVRIPLVTNKAPQVESVNAYRDYIEIIFNQYMKVDDASGITVSVDGDVASIYSWIDPEESPSTEKYSKIVRIVTPSNANVGDTLNILIDNAKNYNGISMESSYNTNTKVTHRPTTIVLNYEDTITIKQGDTKKVVVRVKDENGNYMNGLTVNAVIDNTYLATIDGSGVTDNNGALILNTEGILPGLTSAIFSVSGTTLSKTIDVTVETDPVRTKRPIAVIGGKTIGEGAPKENSITVEAGSKLTLSSATEGAKIYYVKGDSSPCSNCVLQNEYTEPLVINENTKITVVAYKAGLEYSEELVINITVIPKSDSGSGSGSDSTVTPSNNPDNSNKNTNIGKSSQSNTAPNNPASNEPEPTEPSKNEPSPTNNPPKNEPKPSEDITNNKTMSIPLIIGIVAGAGALIVFIFILLGKRKKKDDE